MSQGFMSKLSGLRSSLGGSAGGQGPQNPKTAWWLRLVAKVMGAVGGFVACITAIMAMISLSPVCIIAALLLLAVAVILLIFEAPMCCMFIEKTRPIAAFAERRTYIQKAIIYIVMAIVPLIFCFSLTALFGCALIFITGVIYGYMGMGKRGEVDETAAGGAVDQPPPPYVPRPDESKSGLVENEDNFRNMQSSYTSAGGAMHGMQAAQQGGFGPGGGNMQNTFAAASGAMQGMQQLHGAYAASTAMHGNY